MGPGLAAVKMNALVVNFGNVYLLASPSTQKSVFTDPYQTNLDKRPSQKKIIV